MPNPYLKAVSYGSKSNKSKTRSDPDANDSINPLGLNATDNHEFPVNQTPASHIIPAAVVTHDVIVSPPVANNTEEPISPY